MEPSTVRKFDRGVYDEQFLGRIRGKLADQWITTILTPAFVFWAGGFVVWIIHSGWASLKPLEIQFNQLPSTLQIALLIGGLLGVAISSIVVQRLDLVTLRFLEGYWPRFLTWLGLYSFFVWQQKKRLDTLRNSYSKLVIEEKQRGFLPREKHRERVALDLKLRLAPQDPEQYMPTKLGNILLAAENRPMEKYGLVTAICWPRLWLLLPDGTKKELAEARASLDTAARIVLWSFLFLVWTNWAWWIPLVTLAVAF
jgi:hypothetical protein